jgi:acetyltransferase
VPRKSGSGGLLVILTPQAMADPPRTAELVRPHAETFGKPILASWMGGTEVAAGEAILNRCDIPAFPFPDIAARVFNYMWRYNANLQSLYETPMLATAGDDDRPDRPRADQLIHSLHRKGRTILNEFESKALLEAYGIPVVKMHIAIDEAQAVKIAEKIGYPVVLKLFSETITHKTEVGGVQLNLHDAEAVRRAFRLIAALVQQRGRPQDFMGVTVQPMIMHEGYEIILRQRRRSAIWPGLLFGDGRTARRSV